MRLFLLPVSTRRTLLYCERLGEVRGQPPSLMDKAQARAAQLWAEWEKKPAGSWQQRVVSSGNAALRRVAFEEWGLKSVPPLSARRRVEAAAAARVAGSLSEKEAATPATASPQTPATIDVTPTDVTPAAPVQVVFPPSVLPPASVPGLLHRLSTEREALHRKRLIWCFVGMPITAPVALLPVIPNIPFFYLAYRAWSHWRALSGGKHLQHLLQNNGLVYAPSEVLDRVYTTAHLSSGPLQLELEPERLLLSHPRGSQAVADALGAPALELELERAIWQVETALEANKASEAREQQQAAESRPESGTEQQAAPPPPPPPPRGSDKAQQ